jgi:hypothetical protein
VARIPEGSTVLPAICTEEVITLGAELEDGTVITHSLTYILCRFTVLPAINRQLAAL